MGHDFDRSCATTRSRSDGSPANTASKRARSSRDGASTESVMLLNGNTRVPRPPA